VTVARALAEVRARIDAAALAAGRRPEDVGLVAVSKTFPASAIREAYDAGQRDFGENYAQELAEKRADLADLPGIRWHFVGRVQTNKAKLVAPSYRIHAIDSARHAAALAAVGPVSVLLAVNQGGEAQKSGVAPANALDEARAIAEVPGVTLCGFMTLPPPDADPAPLFRDLAALAEEGRRRGLPTTELSMGMSHDFEAAVAAGATWVRVGTAIFGARG
jgi:pyridoxal phosphate enzyme (YggS family)